MSKKIEFEMSQDVLLADALLRLTALENVLIQKGLITRDELNQVASGLVEKITKVVIDKVQSSKDLNDFIDNLSNEVQKNPKN